MAEPIGIKVPVFVHVVPATPETGAAGRDGTKILSGPSVADKAGPLPQWLQALPGLPVRRSVSEAVDRQRSEQLKKLALQESKVKAVEHSHALNALLVQVSRGQFENLSQLKSHLDAMTLHGKRQMAAELDQALQQLPQQDDNAIKLGLRLNQMFDQVEAGGDATVKLLDVTYTGAPKNTLNIREVLDYIRSKYPETPLAAAARYVMSEFSTDLDSFNAGRDQQARAADNAKYVFALAGMAMARLILGFEQNITALVKGGANDGIRAF